MKTDDSITLRLFFAKIAINEGMGFNASEEGID